MKKSLSLIACFGLAVLACGCQKQVSSNANVTNAERKTVNPSMLSAQTGSSVIAYHFHRTMRCHICLAIETNAARVIENNFSRQISDGQLTWMPYNLDEAGGKDLAKEFDISVSTLVLAKMQDGKHTKFRKLDNVWAYVGDPVKFDDYVKTEVEQFLSE
jgi:hypothetical protein